MSMLFACMAGREGGGGGLEVLKCFVKGGQNFFCLLNVCVGGVGGVRFSTSPTPLLLKVGSCPNDDSSVQILFCSFLCSI